MGVVGSAGARVAGDVSVTVEGVRGLTGGCGLGFRGGTGLESVTGALSLPVTSFCSTSVVRRSSFEGFFGGVGLGVGDGCGLKAGSFGSGDLLSS